MGVLQSGERVLAFAFVSEHAHEHARMAQIRARFYGGNCHESNAWIFESLGNPG
jgi:hypothetical protein